MRLPQPCLCIALVLSVVRVGLSFHALPGSFSGSLAFGLPAILLRWVAVAEGKNTAAREASEGLHGSGLLKKR